MTIFWPPRKYPSPVSRCEAALSLAAFVALLPFAICIDIFSLTGLFLWLALACIAFNLAICWEHRKNAVTVRDQLLTKSSGHSQERDPFYHTV